MPSGEEIQRNIIGAWRLMNGKPDGLRLLDISEDGFWNSFYAIIVALPALFVGWTATANDLLPGVGEAGGRFGVLARLAVIDLAAWVVPLAVLAVLAKPTGLGNRFVHYVVSSNWGSVITVWLLLPASLLQMALPAAADLADLLSLALFGIALVLSWRLTNAVLGRGAAVATAVFVGMFVVSLVVLIVLQTAFGLTFDQTG